MSPSPTRRGTPSPGGPTTQSQSPTTSGGTSTPTRPPSNAPFHPPADTSTYRDLLLFEERLKSNAEMLRRRRRRYSIFLWTFVCALVLGSYRFMMRPPHNIVLLRGLEAAIAVVFITLVLFFASGMYEEKIRYAHSYINHSNKALRPLNMYLNLRRPRPGYLSLIPSPLLHAVPHPPISRKTGTSISGSGSSSRRASSSSGGSTIMAQIPPAQNPRGELIFSSRVDPAFEDGYKRYRAAFERRREEKAREERARSQRAWWVLWRGARGAGGTTVGDKGGGSGVPTPALSRRGTPDLVGGGTGGQSRSSSPAPGKAA